MTNKQLASARKVANRFPDVVFRPVDGGVDVGGQIVLISPPMDADLIEKALRAAAYGAQDS